MPIEWIWGLAGGLLIGAAGSLYLLVNGRIMGASGILGTVVDGTARETRAEKVWFMAGLVIVPGVAAWLIGGFETHITQNFAVIAGAGVLVGLGTRLANGCTSGHGVCGISRLSLRGIVATILYLLAGGIVMLALRHIVGVI